MFLMIVFDLWMYDINLLINWEKAIAFKLKEYLLTKRFESGK